MTFYEAAVEVLRDAGRPLHYKKIAELALARNLLSHKGRTPDQTMCDRLQQEVKKPPGDTLIVQFKPGIFALKEGVDVSEAKETMALHPAPAPEPASEESPAVADKEPRGRRRRGRKGEETAAEPAIENAEVSEESTVAAADSAPASDKPGAPVEPVAVGAQDALNEPAEPGDADAEEQEDDDDESADAAASDAGGTGATRDKRRRRRGRRGGKNRSRGEEGEDGQETNVESPEPAAAPAAPARSQEARRGPAPGRPPAPRAAVGPLVTGLEAVAHDGRANTSPMVATIIGMMQQSHDLADSLRSLSRGVSRAGAGALGRVGPAMVRSELLRMNSAAQLSGQLPTFNEIKPDIWAWGTGFGSELSASVTGYSEWLNDHVHALRSGLAQRLAGQAPAAFQTLVTLLLSRAGYQDLELVDDVPAGFAACLVGSIAVGFSRTRTVFGVVVGDTEVNDELVQRIEALRGSLQGTDAVVVTQSVLPPEVADTFVSRVRISDANDVAQRMIEFEVGVRRVPVSIPVFDEPMFRDAASE